MQKKFPPAAKALRNYFRRHAPLADAVDDGRQAKLFREAKLRPENLDLSLNGNAAIRVEPRLADGVGVRQKIAKRGKQIGKFFRAKAFVRERGVQAIRLFYRKTAKCLERFPLVGEARAHANFIAAARGRENAAGQMAMGVCDGGGHQDL